MPSLIVELKQSNKLVIFFIYCFAGISLTYLANSILVHDDLYYNHFGEQLTFDRIEKIINDKDKWHWIVYPLLPIFFLLKFFIVTLCLLTGALLVGYQINFKKLFQVVLFADFIFLIPPIIKILWFGVFKTNYNFLDLQSFYPLSILSLFNPLELEPWLIYPLQVLNLFELLYWMAIACGLTVITRESFPKMFGLVMFSYGFGLFLWVLVVIFLIITLS